MKKKTIKKLQLDKSVISKFHANSISGGRTLNTVCCLNEPTYYTQPTLGTNCGGGLTNTCGGGTAASFLNCETGVECPPPTMNNDCNIT